MISVFGAKTGQEEIERATEVIASHWLGNGNKVTEFEHAFAARLSLDNFTMIDSASNGLFLAVRLLELPPESEIILPSFTWITCAQAVVLAGHKPIFCDVDLETQNISVEYIVPLITSKTKAILVVHYAGRAVDMEPIIELGLPVIEDAAHAVDTYYKGRACGSVGDIGIYSFDHVKNIATPAGGGITCRDKTKVNKIKTLRNSGIEKKGFESVNATNVDDAYLWWKNTVSDIFIKCMPNDVSASIATAQLINLDELQERRKAVWDLYQSTIGKISGVITPIQPGLDESHSYWTYFIQVSNRDELAKYLLKNGIYTTLNYYPLHFHKIYQNDFPLKNTEKLAESGLNLPLHPNLSNEDVLIVVKHLEKFYTESINDKLVIQ